MKPSNDHWIIIILWYLLTPRCYGSHQPVMEGNSICGFELEETVIVCEDDTIVLQCEFADINIRIISSEYGRTEKGTAVCPSRQDSTLNCTSDSTEMVTEICKGKHHCHLKATNTIFGDPCPHTSKYLTIKFCCI